MIPDTFPTRENLLDIDWLTRTYLEQGMDKLVAHIRAGAERYGGPVTAIAEKQRSGRSRPLPGFRKSLTERLARHSVSADGTRAATCDHESREQWERSCVSGRYLTCANSGSSECSISGVATSRARSHSPPTDTA